MPDILVDNKTIYNIEITIIKLFSYTSKILLILFLIGVLQETPTKFIELNYMLKTVIAFILIYRFNPYRKSVVFTELDRKISYSAGIYIIVTTFVDIITQITHETRAKITPYTLRIIDYLKEHKVFKELLDFIYRLFNN